MVFVCVYVCVHFHLFTHFTIVHSFTLLHFPLHAMQNDHFHTFDLMSIKCIMSKSIYIRLYYVATHQFDMYTHITHRMFPYKCPDQQRQQQQLQQQQQNRRKEEKKNSLCSFVSSCQCCTETRHALFTYDCVYDLKLANVTSITPRSSSVSPSLSVLHAQLHISMQFATM